MARTETILRVFVASPSDLSDERKLLDTVIQELNITWSKTLGIRLEFVSWETHTFPSVGTDGQAVINVQIADEYDIFVGLMWKRFGTSTGRAGSGTVEEFERAYNKHLENSSQVRVMFYFKNAPVSPDELDPEQLSLIKNFKKELETKGVYYRLFTERDEFTQLLRMHLGQQVQEWNKGWGGESNLALAKSAAAAESTEIKQLLIDEDESEEGFLDLFETMQESFDSIIEPLLRMTDSLNALNERISASSNELNQAQLSGTQLDVKQAKRISNRAAEALDNFASLMEVDVPIFANHFSKGIESLSRVIALTKDLPSKEEDPNQAQSQIDQFKSTVGQVKEQMFSFRETIAGVPRATTMFNRARKRAISILDRLDNEFESALNLISEVDSFFNKV